MNRNLPDYMPGDEDGLVKWFDNYFANLPAYQTTFQIEEQDVEAQKAIFNNILQIRSYLNTIVDYRKAMTELKNQLFYNRNGATVPVPKPDNLGFTGLASMLGGLVWLVDLQNKEKIFPSPAYNETIGKDLGLIPIPRPVPLPGELVATPTITCTGHNVEIFCVIPSPADSYAIHVDKHDGKGMAYVDSSTTSHYPHNTELPEIETLWTYKIALRVKRQESGTAAYVNVLVKHT
ncbi:MAG: hypothetical protein LBH01_00010 [Verrucomicrobiales bacterium]|jgi:hypothetical protein|nr:hypothetical protein [Verrucomicrobiales bacterium]